MAYRFNHSMYYANAEQMFEEVSRLAKEAKPPLVWFCIGAGAVDDIDYTAAAALRSIYALLREQGIRLIFFEVSSEVYAQLERSGITGLVGKDAFYTSGAAVFSAYKASQERKRL
jgi:MFS superfamily sulfate permease-like transporter